MKVVLARPDSFSPHDRMTYQAVARDNLEVIVATQCQSYAPGCQTMTFRHADQILALGADVIDVPDLHYGLSMYLASRKPEGTKLVCTGYDNLPAGKNVAAAQWFDVVDVFVARSEMAADALIYDGAPSSRVTIINPGVDTEVFEPLPFVPKEDAVLFVGRLDLCKGLQELIWACRDLDVELWAVGGGDGEPYRDLAEYLGVKLTLFGPKPHTELPKFYQEASLFALPSFPIASWDPYAAWTEQWGVSAMEAMACGLPVIVTDTGAFPEFVTDGETGFMIPARDWIQLRNLIKLLMIDSPALREGMGAEARRVVVEWYSSEVIGDRYAELYRGLP